MEKTSKTVFMKRIISAVILVVLLISSYYFPRGKAEEVAKQPTPIPSNITIVVDEAEKQKLLGNSGDNTNILGLASKFSIFAHENVTLTGADIEGRVAAGGSVTATTPYEYQIGWKNQNDDEADLIVGDGPVSNIALTFGADDNGNIIPDNKKIAVSTKATNMNYADLLPSKVVASDLIDFDSEFEYYNNLSEYLLNDEQDTIEKSPLVSNYYQSRYSRYVNSNWETSVEELYGHDEAVAGIEYSRVLWCKGNNKNINKFSLDATDFRDNIVFDVPYGSYVIVNCTTSSRANLDPGHCSVLLGHSPSIYYTASEEEISELDYTDDEIAHRLINVKGLEYAIEKTENGDFKAFKRILNGSVNPNIVDESSKYILYNFPYANEIYLNSAPGSILAPNANVTGKTGYFAGNLICKSYTGESQFGNPKDEFPVSTNEKYKINVNKIDSFTKEKILDAQFEILDIDRNSLYSWTSGDDIQIELDIGKYILVEKTPGTNYENVVAKESGFTVKEKLIYNEDKTIEAIADISMGANTTEKKLVENYADWTSNSYVFEPTSSMSYNGYEYMPPNKTIDIGNGEKAVICDYGNLGYHITEYSSDGNKKQEFSFEGPDIDRIVKAEKINNEYRLFLYNRDYDVLANNKLYELSYNTETDTLNTISEKALDSSIGKYSALYNMTIGTASRSVIITTDGGRIARGTINGNASTYKIPANYTVDGKEIVYNRKISEAKTYVIIKENEKGKVEWANFFENTGSYDINDFIETENGYIISGGSWGWRTYIDKSQSIFRIDRVYGDDKKSDGTRRPLLLQINKNGKTNYVKHLDPDVAKSMYNSTYCCFDSIKEIDGTIYCKVYNNISEFTKCDFPISWDHLYAGLDSDVRNIRKIAFEVDTSDCSSSDTRDLHVLVAMNTEYRWLDWIECLNWTDVKNGDVVKAPVPAVEEMYPHKVLDSGSKSGTSIKSDLFKYKPYYFRQNTMVEGDTPTEVFDVKNKNIKAIWYTTKEETKTFATQNYVHAEGDTIIVENDHIKTDITLTKTDKDTNAPVESAVYGVYNSSNELVLQGTTNAEGKIVLKNQLLDKGTYSIKEITAPEGYKLSTEVNNFTVSGSGSVEFNVKDEKTKVSITKVDQDGNFLPGAELKVEDMQGNQVAKWTTTQSAKVLVGLNAGTYKIKETFTPTGYAKDKEILFTIDDLGNVYVDSTKVSNINVTNTTVKGTINVTKTGEVYSKLSIKDKLAIYTNYAFKYEIGKLAGVTFELYAGENIMQGEKVVYAKDTKVAEAVTNNLGIATFDNLPLGSYYAVEKQALAGYKTDKTHIVLGLVYKNDTTPIVYATNSLNNERVHTAVSVEKTKKGTTSPVEGAIYGLYNVNELFGEIPRDTLLSTVITNAEGKGTFDIDLPIGDYYVKELESPDGYLLSSEVKRINFSETGNFNLKFEDDYTKVEISKVEKGTTKHLLGAVLELRNSKGTVVDTWTTNGTAHRINELPVGEYVLVEKTPAPGYTTAENIEFNVLKIGDVQSFKMEDDFTKLEISKVEVDSGKVGTNVQENVENNTKGNTEESTEKMKFVPGATLQIFAEDGTEVLDEQGNKYKWVTEENAHLITKLPIGNYVLKEVVTPSGYVTSQDIPFTVKDKNDVQKVTMGDDFTKVNISKLDIETNEKIEGATLQIVDIDNNVVKDENGNPYKWVTTAESKVINKLAIGRYKLVEVEPAPGYIKAEDVEFEVVNSGEVINVIMKDDFTKLGVTKVDENGRPVVGAKLQIVEISTNNETSESTKEETSETSNNETSESTKDVNKVVYEWTTTDKLEQINKILEIGKSYKLVEAKAPSGFVRSKEIEFSVNESGQIILKDGVNNNVNNEVEDENNNAVNTENKGKVVEQITMKDNFARGTIKITKTAQVLAGVTKVEPNGEYKDLEEYRFTYEDGTLSGVIFELYAAEDIVLNGTTKYRKDEKIGEAITNADGVAIFENINIGEYYFVEKQTNSSYEIDKKPVSVVLAYSSDNPEEELVYTVDFKNTRKQAEIKVIKVQKMPGNLKELEQNGENAGKENSEGQIHGLEEIDNQKENIQIRLANVTFGLYTKNEVCGLPANTLLSIAKTDKNGEAKFDIDIPLGEYYVKEIATIDGYVLSEEKQEINFTETRKYELTFENDYTKVKFKKVNEKNELIDNAKLQLQDMDENVIDEWTTKSSEGYVINAKLVAGRTYKLIELEAPEGYNKAEDIEFTVNTDGKITVVKMVDTEKLSGNMPQTGETVNYALITIIGIVAVYGLMNFGRVAYISSKEKKTKDEDK